MSKTRIAFFLTVYTMLIMMIASTFNMAWFINGVILIWFIYFIAKEVGKTANKNNRPHKTIKRK